MHFISIDLISFLTPLAMVIHMFWERYAYKQGVPSVYPWKQKQQLKWFKYM